MHVTLIYPHQLFQAHPAVAPDRDVLLVEDPLFFYDRHYPTRFHQIKLVLHRASMKRYAAETLVHHATRYVDYADATTHVLLRRLAQSGVRVIHVVDPVDFMVEKRLRHEAAANDIALVWYDTPNFLTTPADTATYYTNRKRYFQTDFYVWQRKRLGILLDGTKPLGGRWTYDSDNRHRLAAAVDVPPAPAIYHNSYVEEARAYVHQHFGDHYGSSEDFIYPTSHAEAEARLDDFLQHKLSQFGPYQDAITQRVPFVFHSLISSSLNSGLLSPVQVVQRTLDFYEAHPHTPLASVEGFLRQIIGWREFMRVIYVREGVRQRNSNFWKQTRTLDERWYTGTLGIPPVDHAIHKALKYAYAHHIERLMLLGNFMLLNEIHPDEVYRWFMEMFIDAYDWVMVPNVYGMSQYADGGLITTKPYLSSSNYVRKMSDYKAGDWNQNWDSLYWRFIAKHESFFRSNPRLSVMVSHLDKMGDDQRAVHDQQAESFLKG